MKPTNAAQRECLCLHDKLKEVPSKVFEWAKTKVIPHCKKKSKGGKFQCMECGEIFEKGVKKCPHCGVKFEKEVFGYNKKRHIGVCYFNVLEKIGNYQVVRVFQIDYNFNKIAKDGRRHIGEVTQLYTNTKAPKYEPICLSKLKRNSFMFYSSYEWEIRNYSGSGYYSNPYFEGKDSYIISLHKDVRKLGLNSIAFKKTNFKINEFIYTLKHSSHAETLVKAKFYEFIGLNYDRFGSKGLCWGTVKICIRNNYHPKDISLYEDLLRDLDYLGKDKLNSFYVCPDNLKQSHDKYFAIAEKKRDKIKLENYTRGILRDMKDNPKIQPNINARDLYKDVVLSKNEFKAIILKSIDDYMKEGIIMKNCVLTYYQRKNLVFTVFNKNKKVATVEYDQDEYKLIQCRGKCNSTPKDNAKIREMFNSLENQIKKIKSQTQNIAA